MEMSLSFYSSVFCFEVSNMDEVARLAKNNHSIYLCLLGTSYL